MITKFKNYQRLLEENTTIPNHEKFNVYDEDAIPFAMINGKWYVGDKGTVHESSVYNKALKDYFELSKDKKENIEMPAPYKLKYRGRLWDNKYGKVIKFDQTPPPGEYEKIKQSIEKTYPDLHINLNDFYILDKQNTKLTKFSEFSAPSEEIINKIKYNKSERDREERQNVLAGIKKWGELGPLRSENRIYNFEQFSKLNENKN